MVNNSTNINDAISHQIIEHKKKNKNHVNIYATFVDVDNIDRSHTYKKVPDQSPQDNNSTNINDAISHQIIEHKKKNI
jgi:hypothetical protein